MATTSTKKKKFSWSSLLSLVLAVIPLVLETLENGSDATIEITPDNSGKRLKATVQAVDPLSGGAQISKKFSVANK